MAEVRIRMPDSGVVVDYASRAEREPIGAAGARASGPGAARMPAAGVGTELTEAEREMASLEARNWLRAAVLAGLAEPEPEREAGQ
jgi:hypothetical protein